jgi:hypothetical protein
VPQTNNVTQMKKDKILKFRVTEEEEAQLIKASKDKNINLSDEIRQRVFVPQNEVVPQNKIKPIKPAKPKKASKPTEQQKQTVKTAKNSIYSTAKRPSAKDSPNRTVIKF